jgi:asparagine synthase (glutamine-hydrolysing)
MCGIAGYIGNIQISSEKIEACQAIMYRRGPDAVGFYRDSYRPGRNVCLLHSRLSIIDLDERSNQPFRIGHKLLVCNGELYNYIELKQELLSCGMGFTTKSDTEVLLKTIIEFGWEKGLDKCEGMWAFAVYGEKDGSLLLSRDRFGEKPLYLFRNSTGVYFGSEVKFIRALVGHSLDINYDHLYRYMVNGYKSLYKTKETFFEGISELQPGSILEIDCFGNETERRYWHPGFEEDGSLTYDQAVDGVRNALIRSVKLRLRSDVPLAFCMSGGIDSNSLISIAKRVFGYDVHGFTIVNEDERYEEQALVDHAVRELNIKHTAVPITTKEFLEDLRELVKQHDAPIYTISYYVHWLLMGSLAEQGYKISISGTAADELLTGYYDHHNLYLYEIRDTPLFESALAGWKENIAPIVRNPFLQNPYLYFENFGIRDHIFLKNREFADYFKIDWLENFSESEYTGSLLRNRMLNEMFHEAVPVILHEDDLNAMYYSIENRSPYLDRELFEFCYRIPSKHLVRNGLAKVILRDAMAGVVPERILENPRKVGFNAPVFSFLDVNDEKTRSYLMDQSPIFDHVRRDKIEALISKSFLLNSESKFLFYFLNSKVFLEEFSK